MSSVLFIKIVSLTTQVTLLKRLVIATRKEKKKKERKSDTRKKKEKKRICTRQILDSQTMRCRTFEVPKKSYLLTCILSRQLPHLRKSEIIAGHIQKLNHYDSKDYNKKN